MFRVDIDTKSLRDTLVGQAEQVRSAINNVHIDLTPDRSLFQKLLDAGIQVHGQVVVCPGINDGDELDDTLLGVLDRFPGLATVGVVPLGVSAHNREPEMRPHSASSSS